MPIYGAEILRKIFNESVEVVKPGPAIRKHINLINDKNEIIECTANQNEGELRQPTGICIDGKPYQLLPHYKDGLEESKSSVTGMLHECYYNVTIIGFGKAVVGMALELIKILSVIQKHNSEKCEYCGILLVPFGSYQNELGSHPNIEVIEGAKGNIPDEDAFRGTQKIYKLVEETKKASEKSENVKIKELILVLISGGGSALLTYPIPPITLSEKSRLVCELSKAGADISQLNKVRKCLSMVKGGKLASLATPAEMCSFILSDIIGDPLDLIASGPTKIQKQDVKEKQQEALKIIKHLKISIPTSVTSVLSNDSSTSNFLDDVSHVRNILIANNTLALTQAQRTAQEHGFESYILSSELCGIASEIGIKLSSLALHMLNQTYPIGTLLDGLNLGVKSLDHILMKKVQNPDLPLCLIFGGETVVKVSGNGKGGRNLELSLAAALHLHSSKKAFDDLDVQRKISILSAGTDGIDGPTDVAGAVVDNTTIEQALKQGLDPVEYLKNNDSYNFFQQLNGGENFVITGHTGTNVMDIQMVLIQ